MNNILILSSFSILVLIAIILGSFGMYAYQQTINNNKDFNNITSTNLTSTNLFGSNIGVSGKAVYGNDNSLQVIDNTATATLTDYSYNATDYDGSVARVLTLPPATVGNKCVVVLSFDPSGGSETLTLKCRVTDFYEIDAIIPSTVGNYLTSSQAGSGELTRIVFSPTNSGANFMSFGSKIALICFNEGKWQVNNVDYHLGSSVSAGNIKGTLRFLA